MSSNQGTRADDGVAIAPARRGRPRDVSLREAVLRAAAELALVDGHRSPTIDAIAKRAAVSRTTVYRWWPSAAAIVLEGLLGSTVGSIIRPVGSTPREAVEHHVRSLNAITSDAATGPLVRRVISAADSDRAVGQALREQWLLPRRAALTSVLTEAAERGELRDGADPEVMVDALVSPAYYRLMLGLPPLDDAAVAELVDTVWRGSARRLSGTSAGTSAPDDRTAT